MSLLLLNQEVWSSDDDWGLITGHTKKYPLEIQWSEGGRAVYVLGTFTDRKALLLKKSYDSLVNLVLIIRGDIHTITVDAEPGAHRFRFVVNGESRTSSHYRLATDHQNVVVNYLDHVKPDDEPEYESDDEEGI
jgi:5'-AMP-activated protein kinase, regulatory beta subunit